ncbi:hypothetical protein QYE76_027759 [Lolium multiflorum]|uniref:RNase H type-1 domain-containing protein n=1 Tax=Lolium multiflorum TaxID=4521 RepID=A0AAD8VGC9_LOLMU|nr:hypothetical protein QYE76_027759 [Lolium multiflorum]
MPMLSWKPDHIGQLGTTSRPACPQAHTRCQEERSPPRLPSSIIIITTPPCVPISPSMTTDGALAEDLAMNRLFVVSDCKLLVSDINEGTMGSYASPIIVEIRSRTTKFQECSFSHDSRASNFEAPNLARHMMLITRSRLPLVARHPLL